MIRVVTNIVHFNKTMGINIYQGQFLGPIIKGIIVRLEV